LILFNNFLKGKNMADFEWKSIVTEGIKKGIGGIATTSAAYGLAWALDSVFGLELGKPGRVDQKNQMIEELKQIQGEMEAMNTALIRISDQVESLEKEVSLDFYKTIAAIEASTTIEAITHIQTQWTSLCSRVQVAALRGVVPVGTTRQLTGVILDAKDGIDYQINLITNSLMPMVGSTGLLDNWTSALILEILQGASLRTSYLWFEQSFLQYIQYIQHGHSLLVAALIQKNWMPEDSLEVNNARAKKVGEQYMTQQAGNNLALLTEMFVQCVYRLILCQYRVSVETTSATVPVDSKNFKFIPFTSQADADFILGRTNLLNWQINRDAGDAYEPGLMITSFLRPSQLQNGQAPALGSSASNTSHGSIFALKYGYDKNWYKVVDHIDGDVTQIRDVADSSISVANYHFPVENARIVNPSTGWVLSSPDNPAEDQASVLARPSANDTTELWQYQSCEGGFKIIQAATGRILDGDVGGNVYTTAISTNQQVWSLVVDNNGLYAIQKNTSGLVLDINSGNNVLFLKPGTSNPMQEWKTVGEIDPVNDVQASYYDLNTLERVSSKTSNSVLYGHTTQLSGITDEIFFSSLALPALVRTSENIDQPGFTYSTSIYDTRHLGQDRSYIQISAKMTEQSYASITTSITYKCSIEFYFRYMGASAASLMVDAKASGYLSADAGFDLRAGEHLYEHIALTGTASYGISADTISPTSSADIAVPNLGEPRIDETIPALFRTLVIAGDQKVTLSFDITSTTHPVDTGNSNNFHSGTAVTDINWTIYCISLGWPQPKVA
jgi:hypothetical protein